MQPFFFLWELIAGIGWNARPLHHMTKHRDWNRIDSYTPIGPENTKNLSAHLEVSPIPIALGFPLAAPFTLNFNDLTGWGNHNFALFSLKAHPTSMLPNWRWNHPLNSFLIKALFPILITLVSIRCYWRVFIVNKMLSFLCMVHPDRPSNNHKNQLLWQSSPSMERTNTQLKTKSPCNFKKHQSTPQKRKWLQTPLIKINKKRETAMEE